jgi:hypothetical protein
MAAGAHNFKIEQGATFNNTITYKNAASVAINISGATITLKAKDNRSDTNFVITLSVDNGITLSNPSAGEFKISIPAATTAAYKFNRADYDLDITLSGTVTRLLTGQIQIIKSVSG